MKKIANILYRAASGILILFGILVLAVLVRIFVFDRFPVNSNSMEPAIIAGDKIGVNKLLFGARIYKNLDFFKGAPMESWRMPGFRTIRHNDIVVFNHSIDRKYGKIVFGLTPVYVKRCVGLPGDTLAIVNGYYRNNAHNGILGNEKKQQELAHTDSATLDPRVKRVWRHVQGQHRWTIFGMGPFVIPEKDAAVTLDSMNYNIYRFAIEYETGRPLTCRNGNIYLGENETREYVFQKNYYFFAGDNVLNSQDSRYWGFVPEEHIIGIATRILSSRDPYTKRFRWDRFYKKLR